MQTDLLNLPFAIQLALGSGYAAYLIAFSGLRQHHTPTDTVFRTISFGLVASFLIQFLPSLGVAISTAGILAFIATILVGALWRAFVGRWLKGLISVLLISWSDDLPTAWLSITAERTDFRPSQIVVELNDGRLLMCDNTRDFQKVPFGPAVFGLDGSVAMYVTSERRPDGEWVAKPNEEVIHQDEGAKITYVAPGNIKRVEIRNWTKKPKTLPRWFRRRTIRARRFWSRLRRRWRSS